jgi:hypothetical protein
MNDRLEQIQKQLEEIAKLNLTEQPEAYQRLYEELNSELNSANSDSEQQ